MSKNKVAKVSTKSGKKGSQAPRANGKRAELTPKKRAELVEAVARLGIELHREALKELERY